MEDASNYYNKSSSWIKQAFLHLVFSGTGNKQETSRRRSSEKKINVASVWSALKLAGGTLKAAAQRLRQSTGWK